MGVLLWIGYTAVAIVLMAAIVAIGITLGALIAGCATLALCVCAIFLVASVVKEAVNHLFHRPKRVKRIR